MQNKGHGKERRGKDRYMKINKKIRARENQLKQHKTHMKINNEKDKRKVEEKRITEKGKNNSTMKERRKRKRQKVQDTDLQETE